MALEPRQPLVLAHRGDHRRWIENTADALLDALLLPGVDGVEFDVRVAADGEPVILHDESLQRTFGVPLLARNERSVALEARGVPHLARMLSLLPESAFLDVELKDVASPATYAALRDARGERLHRGVISSFQAPILAEVRARQPRWPAWLNAVTLDRFSIAAARTIGCRGIAAHWSSVNAGSVRAARDAGLEIAVWTVRRRATRARVERLGVDVVIVEGPALEAASASEALDVVVPVTPG